MHAVASASHSQVSRARRRVLEPLDRALRQLRGRAHERLRAVDQRRESLGQLGRALRARLGAGEALRERALGVEQPVQRLALRRFERERRELRAGRAEILPDLAVVVEQRGIVEDDLLAHDPLERRRLLEEEPARARGLRGLQHFLAALRRESIDRQQQLRERVKQRQAHQQERQQDELEEGSRVIHLGRGLL
mgnify:CR=1 FL=1